MTLPAGAKIGYEVLATIGGKADGIRNVNFNNSAGEADITTQQCAGKKRSKAALRAFAFTCEVLWGSEAYTTIAAAFKAGTALTVTHSSPTADNGQYSVLGMSEVRGNDAAISANCSFAFYNET